MSDQGGDDRRWLLIRRSLDRQRVCNRLNMCVDWPDGTHVTAVRVRRFMPRRRLRFDIEYELLLQRQRNGREHLQRAALFARCPESTVDPPSLPPDPGAPTVSGDGVSGICVFDDDLGLSFHTPDCDPALSQYSRCMDGAWMAEWLRGLGLIPRETPMNTTGPAEPLHCERVTFRLGRRFVIRYTRPGGKTPGLSWAGKCYADHRGQRFANLYRQLHGQLMSITRGRVRLPRLLHYDGELRMLLTVWNGGQSEGVSPHPEHLARLAAEALVAIQSASLRGLEHVDRTNQWQVLQRWHSCIINLQPVLARRAATLMDALAAARDSLPTQAPVLVHRDFYETQLVVGSDGATVLDLDTLAMGDRSLDIGNYLAHQWLWCLERSLPFNRFRPIAKTVLDAYEQGSAPLDESALAFCWASSLFRVGAIHAFRDNTSRYASALWDMVQPVLNNGRRALESSATLTVSGGPASVGLRVSQEASRQ